MNRRNFIARSATAAVGIGVAGLARGETFARLATDLKLPYKVIFDRRFDAARQFAAGAARLGCRIEPIAGDVTVLWREDLRPTWSRGEGAIVGMTTTSSLLCLDLLARDHWMKVVARAEHCGSSAGGSRHRLFLDDLTLADVSAALDGDAHWPARLAAPLIGQLNRDRARRAREPVVISTDSRWPPQSEPLVSWVIVA